MSENVVHLPLGWSLARLDDLVASPKLDIVDGPFGSNLKASEYVEYGVPIVRLQNVSPEGFIRKNIKFVTEEKAARLKRHSFISKDIVVTKLGDPLGEACIIPEELEHGIIVADIVRVRTHQSLDRAALTYAINSDFVQRQFKELTKGTTRPRVNLSHVRGILIPVAPFNEQKRIVEEIEKELTRLDAAVVALKRVQANLKRYRASVLKAACEGRLVPTEAELARKEGLSYETGEQLLARILADRRAKWEADQLAKMTAASKPPKDNSWKEKYKEPKTADTGDLPELPEGWCWASLDQLTVLITSGSRGWADFYSEQGATFIRAQDINTDRLDLSAVAHVNVAQTAEGARTRVCPNDLLVTITGANVTKTAVVNVDPGEAYVSQHVGLVRPAVTEIAQYVYTWIVSPSHGRRVLERHAYGAGKPGLNLDQLRELPVAIPPLSEQARICSAVDLQISAANHTAEAAELGLLRTDRLRQSILKCAFDGKLVPQDPNDEPASVLLGRIQAERQQAPAAASKRRSKKAQISHA